jgi:hypothetical protein
MLYTRTPDLTPPIVIGPCATNDFPIAEAARSRIPLFTMYASPDSTVRRLYSSGTSLIINASFIRSLAL